MRRLAPVLPYAAVLVGLYALESAWAAIAIYHAGAVALWLAAGRRPPLRALISGRDAGAAAALAALGLAAGPAVYLAWPCAALDPDLAAALARFGLAGGSLVAFALYSAAVNPWLEELLWRGLLGDPSPRPRPADALFAGYHALVLALVVSWPFALAGAAALFAVAWLWRAAAARCGGLLVPCLSHLAADLAVIGGAWALLAG